MPLPLKKFANCTIIFTIHKELVQDDNFNIIPSVEPLPIKAILTKPKLNTNTNNLAIDLEGHLQVTELPNGVKLPDNAQIVFRNGVEGTAKVFATVPSPYYKENLVKGIPITVLWSD